MSFTPFHFPTKASVEEKPANKPLADISSLCPGDNSPESRNPYGCAPTQSQLELDARHTQNAHIAVPKDCLCRNPHSPLYFPADYPVDCSPCRRKGAPSCTAGKGMTTLDHILADLSDSIPAAGTIAPEGLGVAAKDLQGQAPREVADQMIIIGRATAYISLLEDRSRLLLDERRALKSKIAAFEKLFPHQ